MDATRNFLYYINAGIGPQRAALRTIALDAKSKRLAMRQQSVEVSRIPGLPRASSMEQNGTIYNDKISGLQEGHTSHPNIRTKSDPVMIQKISYT